MVAGGDGVLCIAVSATGEITCAVDNIESVTAVANRANSGRAVYSEVSGDALLPGGRCTATAIAVCSATDRPAATHKRRVPASCNPLHMAHCV